MGNFCITGGIREAHPHRKVTVRRRTQSSVRTRQASLMRRCCAIVKSSPRQESNPYPCSIKLAGFLWVIYSKVNIRDCAWKLVQDQPAHSGNRQLLNDTVHSAIDQLQTRCYSQGAIVLPSDTSHRDRNRDASFTRCVRRLWKMSDFRWGVLELRGRR